LSTDLKGVAMKAGTISLMGVRGANAGRPGVQGYRRADSAATASVNVKKCVHAIKPLLTGADAGGVELFAPHSVPLDETRTQCTVPKG
jgi:hypothetical protein